MTGANAGTVRIIKGDQDVTLPLVKNDGMFTYGVDVQTIGSYPPKQVIGDFSRADHEFLSTLVQSDWSGGGQIIKANEATDGSRYAGIATLETRFPNQLCLLPEVLSVTDASGLDWFPLGDVAEQFWAACGTRLWRVNGATKTDSTVDLAGFPWGKPMRFQGTGSLRLYIPLGSNGYQTWDGTTLSAVSTAAQPISLAVWDRKLYSLDWDGSIRQSLDGVAWTLVTKLDGGVAPRQILRFFDAQGSPALQIVSDEGVYGVDVAAPALYDSQDTWPPHPDAATGSAVWRADLWTGVGLDVRRYTLTTVSESGLSRDDGVPSEYLGAIRDICATYNDLFALLEGAQQSSGERASWQFDASEETDLFFAASSARTALLRYDGLGGWHTLWASEAAQAKPTWAVVSARADNAYRLYWGAGGNLFCTALPRQFANPKVVNTSRYQLAGRMESSRRNMQMENGRIGLAAIEVRTRDCTAGQTVRVFYQTDRLPAGTWIQVAELTDDGLHRFQLGANGTMPDGVTTRYDGVSCGWVRYAVEMTSDDPTKSPVVDSVSIVFLKIPGTLKAWTFQVDCVTDTNGARGQGYGMPPRARQDFLDALLDYGRDVQEGGVFVPLCYQDRWYAARFTGVAGRDSTGRDLRGNRQVTAIMSFES